MYNRTEQVSFFGHGAVNRFEVQRERAKTAYFCKDFSRGARSSVKHEPFELNDDACRCGSRKRQGAAEVGEL
jgi:hypothetical protein